MFSASAVRTQRIRAQNPDLASQQPWHSSDRKLTGGLKHLHN